MTKYLAFSPFDNKAIISGKTVKEAANNYYKRYRSFPELIGTENEFSIMQNRAYDSVPLYKRL